MSALMFTLKAKLTQRVDCSALTPDGLRGKTGAEIEHIELPMGNTNIAVAEIFKVKGRDSDRVIFSGDSASLIALAQECSAATLSSTAPRATTRASA